MCERTPTYYAIIPADVRYDERLRPNEKLLYGEITALSSKNGDCWASNDYFAELYNVTIASVSSWISRLQKFGYIEISMVPQTGQEATIRRKIHIGLQKNLNTSAGGLQKNLKENNTRNINNKNILKDIDTSKKEIVKEKRFQRPSVDDIRAYCRERGNSVDPEAFYDYYESNGWKVGRAAMKDWRAAVRTWEKNRFEKNNKKSGKKYDPDGYNELPF